MRTIDGGIFTALVTPYKNGRVNPDMYKRLIELNRKNGIDRFYGCGSAAEQALLSVDERKEILSAVLAEKPERVIAHVGGQNAADCYELARDAGRKGADAVSAVTPYYYKYTISEITRFYGKLADASGLPVVLYNIPSLTGMSFSEEQLTALLSHDCFCAVKFTSADILTIERIKRRLPDKAVFNGCDEIMYYGLAAGADGAIGATFNVMSDKATELYKAFGRGDNATCARLQNEICDVIAVTSRLGGRKCVKALLDMMGYNVGNMREPFEPLSEEALDTLKNTVLGNLTLTY